VSLASAPNEAARSQPPAANVLDIPTDMGDGLAAEPPRLPGAEPFKATQFGNHVVVSHRTKAGVRIIGRGDVVGRGDGINRSPGDHAIRLGMTAAEPGGVMGLWPTWLARRPMYVAGVFIEGLDHVQVAAPGGCEVEARRFFGELLGLVEVEKPQSLRARGGVWFQIGHQQLHVGVEETFAPARKAHPALRVRPDALDELAARLTRAGAKVLWDDELNDVRRFYSEDPWGNRIEFLATR
jgi:catechol 2,3-dioxygenase-like lactoylglutathione lyase family enzyme